MVAGGGGGGGGTSKDPGYGSYNSGSAGGSGGGVSGSDGSNTGGMASWGINYGGKGGTQTAGGNCGSKEHTGTYGVTATTSPQPAGGGGGGAGFYGGGGGPGGFYAATSATNPVFTTGQTLGSNGSQPNGGAGGSGANARNNVVNSMVFGGAGGGGGSSWINNTIFENITNTGNSRAGNGLVRITIIYLPTIDIFPLRVDFSSTFVGYIIQPTQQLILINNTEDKISGLVASISAGSDKFQISHGLSNTTIGVGEIVTISVSPVIGLKEGIHTGDLKITNSMGSVSIIPLSVIISTANTEVYFIKLNDKIYYHDNVEWVMLQKSVSEITFNDIIDYGIGKESKYLKSEYIYKLQIFNESGMIEFITGTHTIDDVKMIKNISHDEVIRLNESYNIIKVE